ncbi:6-phospho-3-hexuloisomerase [Microbacterium ginsengiterrae]|uniref:6-phospho-3-hexuloisomerase n=1 Tax=Microbacterium ginsengiterrae TaxID=546115 RepID=A0A7W9CAD3_9MICO|nr:6-phospho-3-hexuloisomerase [Microbacterium ginsengiterrae]MBB5741950.1 6-phospho-3-hexuloisomerase [Microbacterium ginsengiterrae]
MAYAETQQRVVAEIASTMATIDEADVVSLVSALQAADQIFFVGVGRVKLALEGIAKRLAHLGLRTVVVGQITEPAITDRDLLVVGSGSGESVLPLAIANKAKQHGAAVAHIGSNPNSSMKQYSDVFVRIPVQTKLGLPGEIASQQPMTSLFEQCLLLLGDSVALMIVEETGVDLPGLWKYHANLE